MPFDASQASLTELFRSLNVAPDYKDALVLLAQKVSRLEHEAEHQQMLYEAEEPAPRPVPSSGPRHKRDRHGLRVIPGGLAAFAPVAFLCHDGLALAAGAGWRLLWRSKRAQLVTTVSMLALGAGTAMPTIAALEARPAPAYLMPAGHDHDRPPARPLHHHGAPLRYPVPPGMARSAHRQHPRRDQEATARPSPSPSPSPADPSPLPTAVPSPSASLGASGAIMPDHVPWAVTAGPAARLPCGTPVPVCWPGAP